MQLEQFWAKTTARRIVAETMPVTDWRRNQVRATAAREQLADDRGNVVTKVGVSLADILGAGFTPGRRMS